MNSTAVHSRQALNTRCVWRIGIRVVGVRAIAGISRERILNQNLANLFVRDLESNKKDGADQRLYSGFQGIPLPRSDVLKVARKSQERKGRGMTERGSAAYQLFLLFLSIYVLSTLAIEPFIEDAEIRRVLQFVDFGICLVFLLDFFGNLYRAESKLGYLKWGWIDFISSIPMIDPLRWGRLARVIRILRFLRTLRSGKELLRAISQHRIQAISLVVVFLTLIAYATCSSLILKYESEAGAAINTSREALWWGFLNILNAKTSIDQAITAEGQILTIVLNKVGLLLFAYLNALIISWMVGVRTRSAKPVL